MESNAITVACFLSVPYDIRYIVYTLLAKSHKTRNVQISISNLDLVQRWPLDLDSLSQTCRLIRIDISCWERSNDWLVRTLPLTATISIPATISHHLSITISNPVATISGIPTMLPNSLLVHSTAMSDLETTIPRLHFSPTVTRFVLSLRDTIFPLAGPRYVFPQPVTCLINYIGMLMPWIAFCFGLGVAARHITFDLRGRFNIPGKYFDILASVFQNLRNLRTLDLVFDDVARIWNHRTWLSDFWNKFWRRVRGIFCHPGQPCTCCAHKPQIRVWARGPNYSERCILPGDFADPNTHWYMPLREWGKGWYYSL